MKIIGVIILYAIIHTTGWNLYFVGSGFFQAVGFLLGPCLAGITLGLAIVKTLES